MKYSVLNLVPLREGQSFKEAMDDMVELAKKVEEYGYERYWIAEHHNSPTIASSATSLLILHALSNTNRIRVGSGGVMLPNHNPYIVAEQYGTLETLFPNRIDLGLGRAPGTDLQTAKFLRRDRTLHLDFERDIAELESYFKNKNLVNAYPALGFDIPFYILGSSTDSAHLAAKLGLPYVFAAHFAPAALGVATRIYLDEFKPSEVLDKPYIILAMNAVLADTDEEAKILFTSHIQAILNLVTNNRMGILHPVENEEVIWQNHIKAKSVPHFGPVAFDSKDLISRERSVVEDMSGVSLIGSKETAWKKLQAITKELQIDEIMVNSLIYDQEAQHKSYKLLAEMMREKFS